MSNLTKFTQIPFEDEPEGQIPLSSLNINDIQTRINTALSGTFGSTIRNDITNPNIQYRDGVYHIPMATVGYPFRTTSGYGFLIILSKVEGDVIADGEIITQIAINNEDIPEVWIRCGEWRTSNNRIDFESEYGYNWTKLESVTQIYTDSTIEKTNIKIDDKYVYVKRISFASLPNNGTLTISTGITESITPYKVEGMAYRSTDKVYFPIPYGTEGVAAIGINYNDTSKIIAIIDYIDRTNCSGYVDFYFTYND